MKSLICFAGAAVTAAALAFSGSATAGPIVFASPDNPEMLQTVVKLGDLDLARPAGAEAAVKRIRRGAKAVCGDVANFVYPLALTSGWRACTKTSTANAVNRLDHPMVTRAAFGEKAPTALAAR